MRHQVARDVQLDGEQSDLRKCKTNQDVCGRSSAHVVSCAEVLLISKQRLIAEVGRQSGTQACADDKPAAEAERKRARLKKPAHGADVSNFATCALHSGT